MVCGRVMKLITQLIFCITFTEVFNVTLKSEWKIQAMTIFIVIMFGVAWDGMKSYTEKKNG